jgi:hypothetical protein
VGKLSIKYQRHRQENPSANPGNRLVEYHQHRATSFVDAASSKPKTTTP